MDPSRFVGNRFSEAQRDNSRPIFDYQNSPTLTLEEAVEKIIPLVPQATNYMITAKEKCNRDSLLLTQDESAAIYLYTIPGIPFYFSLNTALRSRNRSQLERWYAFLQIFTTALNKLPSTKATIWRGVNFDDTTTYVHNDIQICWSVISCSRNLEKVGPFLAEGGTLFAIDAINGKDISAFSAVPDEQEVALMPGTCVRRMNGTLDFTSIFVIHLEEVIPRK